MADDLIFEDVNPGSTSGFDPNQGYIDFLSQHGDNINLNTIRTFFLNAPKAKASLKNRPERQMRIRFGDWSVIIQNNHFPANRNNILSDNDLTLYRISGYFARHVIGEYKGSNRDSRELIEQTIINPIAESNGIAWSCGAEIYLSFYPGSEMFLKDFKFYPLAIGLYRAKNKDMPAQFLKKTLRQRYGEKTSDVWMVQNKKEIHDAVKRVSQLPWGKSGLSKVAKEFLAEFGIKE
ncbi:nucleocapsid protein [Kowanyama virus]|uniref:Nucleoprotein n=1 Tax=Kowanyama virus TaxID=1819306 RepID=A0A142J8F4_9VIRU|nr:nucleocapsid protein [Kowanyama virus]AMR73393.1 nucleocapsid protein [Kowanyama virus]